MLKKSQLLDFFYLYLTRHIEKICFIIICELSAAICSPFIAFAMKKIIDNVSLNIDNLTFDKIKLDFYFLVIVASLYLITNRLSGLTNMFTMPIIRMEIRRDIFSYLQKHSHNFFSNNFSGALGHKVNELSRHFSMVISMFLFHFLPITISFLLTIYLITKANINFAIAVTIWAIIYLSVSLRLAKGLKIRSKNYAEQNSIVSGKIIDSITNIFNVRAFANYDYEESYINKYLNKELKAQREMFIFMEINRLFQGVANLVLLCGLILLSIYMLINKNISLGQFVMIYSLTYIIINNLDRLSNHILEFFESIGSIKNSVETINQPYELIDDEKAPKLKIKEAKIEFKNLNFYYNKNNFIFKDLNVDIKPHEKVGIVGISGSGKTTFINLLFRFYDLHSGKILIDNQDISKVSQNSLRNQITLIPQDPILFNRTIFENIKYGNFEATDDEVYEAAKKAECHDFILKLSDGYSSIVGERGIKLSGGQKQRIAIARAFLKNSPILIMDEATSSLDSLTEDLINTSLKSLVINKTVIVIAHRLSTLKLMDRIIVFKNGKIIESGSHKYLLELNGEYSNMWNMQINGMLNDKSIRF